MKARAGLAFELVEVCRYAHHKQVVVVFFRDCLMTCMPPSCAQFPDRARAIGLLFRSNKMRTSRRPQPPNLGKVQEKNQSSKMIEFNSCISG
jgi:hypothetical protein